MVELIYSLSDSRSDDKTVWKARFSDVDRKLSMMVPMSSLPAACSRHGDQQLWRPYYWQLTAWQVVPADYCAAHSSVKSNNILSAIKR